MSDGSSRADRKRAERIALLERAAAKLFAHKGFEATSFDDVALTLDLRGPSLYHYFASKEDLFLGCIRRSASEVFSRLDHVVVRTIPSQGPRAALEALFREQILIEIRDYPEFVPLFFRLLIPIPALQEEVLYIRRKHAALFERITLQALGSGTSLASHDRVRLEIAFGALSYLPSWYRPEGSLAPEDLANMMARHLVDVVVPVSRSTPTIA
ncbi:MAG: TetR family transcriptional regulator [Acidimicrobiales bacterium]